MQAVEDTTYNGWKNYPTWCVNMWLSNERETYDEATFRAREAMYESYDHPTSEYWTVEESRRYAVADVLEFWVTNDLVPDLGASFPADLLGYALSFVDWNEIADSWIETVEGK